MTDIWHSRLQRDTHDTRRADTARAEKPRRRRSQRTLACNVPACAELLQGSRRNYFALLERVVFPSGAGSDGEIPVPVDFVPVQAGRLEDLHLPVGDQCARGVGVGVTRCLGGEPGFIGGRRDRLDHDLVDFQGPLAFTACSSSASSAAKST